MGLRALVVDDEPDLARLVGFNLGAAGFDVAIAHRGGEALDAARASPPDVVVLDLGLPDLDGFEVCRQLRGDARTSRVGVVMITAAATLDEDRIDAFEAGADDFMVKPLNVKELVLRTQAVVRRSGIATATDLLVCGEVTIDRAAREVIVAGECVELRRLEVLLLEHLITNRGRTFSRRELLAQVWKVRTAANARIVDVTVSRLRVGLGSAGAMIETVPGQGYRAV